MIMIQMSGGLGNQMFCYALYKALQEAGKDVCIEEFTHYKDVGRQDNRLREIFKVEYQSADRNTYNRLTDSSLAFLQRVRRKLTGRRGRLYQEKDATVFEPEIFSQSDCYAEGYWQSFRYFEKAEDILRKEFTFDWDNFPQKAKAYKRDMEQNVSVSLHVRRGDYLNEKFAPIYGGICTDAYYEGAKAYMKEKYPDCVFYLFTNDAQWGRTQEKDDVVFVDCTDAESAYMDMALMSSCKHNITANSSFSWWGAWLNINPDKTVIMPEKWLNISAGQDIYWGLGTVKVDARGIITEKV